jgi:uncharacterized protein YdaU (DUF1376 family)
MTLLCYAWDHDGVPTDEVSRRRILGCTKHEHEKIWRTVGQKFTEKNGLLVNVRQEAEREKNQKWREERSKSGRKGAEVRWRATSSATSSANGSGKALRSIPIPVPKKRRTQIEKGLYDYGNVSEHRENYPTYRKIIDLWNTHTTIPIPKVSKLTPARSQKLRSRLVLVPEVAEWERVVKYVNTQDWMRADGQGKYPNWTVTFDYLIRSDETLLGIMEKMHTPVPVQTPRIGKPNGNISVIHDANQRFIGGTSDQ